jgi:hypothetical protein
MLPILRIVPVGGVFLAIMILVLALGPPGSSRSRVNAPMLSARGPLMQIDEHPEWRQFLIRAALRRADELSQLRNLPDEPVRNTEQDEAKVAGLPVERSDAEPEDVTGTINEAPAATIPIDIGETSSTELAAIMPEDKPPVIKTPGRVKSKIENRRKTARRFRRAKVVKPAPPAPPLSLFEAIFGVATTQQASAAVPQANQQPAIRAGASQH